MIKKHDGKWDVKVVAIPLPCIYHKSNPKFRDSIRQTGLIPAQGEKYVDKEYPPAVFCSNVDHYTHPDMYSDSSDNDVWKIDTTVLSKHIFYKDIDISGEFSRNHIYTLMQIPLEAIELVHEGTTQD